MLSHFFKLENQLDSITLQNTGRSHLCEVLPNSRRDGYLACQLGLQNSKQNFKIKSTWTVNPYQKNK